MFTRPPGSTSPIAMSKGAAVSSLCSLMASSSVSVRHHSFQERWSLPAPFLCPRLGRKGDDRNLHAHHAARKLALLPVRVSASSTALEPPAATNASQPYVQSEVSYLKLTGSEEELVVYAGTSPAQGPQPSTTKYEAYQVDIRDIRHMADPPRLDRNGFELLSFEPRVQNYYDDEEVKSMLYADVEELAKRVTGASHVVILYHSRRKRPDCLPRGQIAIPPPTNDGESKEEKVQGAAEQPTPAVPQPVQVVHTDFSETSGPARVQKFCGEDALAHRNALLNVWIPIKGPVLDAPLGLCDPTSVPPEDVYPVKFLAPNLASEVYFFTHRSSHKWYYVSEMMPNEVLVFKSYDSNHDVARYTPHCSFFDPNAPDDAPRRESIELRVALVWNE